MSPEPGVTDKGSNFELNAPVSRAELTESLQGTKSVLDRYLVGMPPFAADLARIDLLKYGSEPESGKVLSFAQVYRSLIDKKVMGVCGGSKLEADTHPAQRIYAALNHQLGIELAEHGWSVCSGGGPGKAMKGLPYCLQQALTPDSKNLSVSVLSGLDDEKPHRYTDLMVRSPGDIGIREKMIVGLSKIVLVYPGNIGTYDEIFTLMMQHYVDGRGSYSTEPPPFVLVSYNDEALNGGHYFARIYDLLENARIAGLSKGEDYEWMKLLVLPNPVEFSCMRPRAREELMTGFAKQIVEIAEQEWLGSQSLSA